MSDVFFDFKNSVINIYILIIIEKKNKRDPDFDSRDVYLITQNALADGTYLQYIRAHYNRSAQLDVDFFRNIAHKLDPAHSASNEGRETALPRRGAEGRAARGASQAEPCETTLLPGGCPKLRRRRRF